MSRTDKDRPYWVRATDTLDKQRRRVEHSAWLHARGECDMLDVYDSDSHRNTFCTSHLDFHIWSSGARQSREARLWHRQDRAAQRRITTDLRRAANAGWVEDAEDLIDNRPVHRGACYGGGWWD